MIRIAFDEYGKFENIKSKKEDLAIIAGFLYDDKNVEEDRNNELHRITEYLRTICRDSCGSFPKDLHYDATDKTGRSKFVEINFAKTISEFLNEGTLKGKELYETKRKGQYYAFSLVKSSAGKNEVILDDKKTGFEDTLLSNLYIHMTNDVISRMIFNNPVIKDIDSVYFDLPTRVYRESNISEELKDKYKSFGHRIKETDDKDIIYLTGGDSFRSSIERELYHYNKSIEIKGIDARKIEYNTTNSDEQIKMGFLYMSDLLCALVHQNEKGRWYKQTEILNIPNRLLNLCGVETLSFFYDDVDTYFSKAYDNIRAEHYTKALEIIYDGMKIDSECRDYYKEKWFDLLLNKINELVNPKSYAEAVNDFKEISKSSNIEQNKLVFIAKQLEKFQKDIEFESNEQMTVLYDYYQTAASAYNHIASTKEANRCLKKAKEYIRYVSVEKRLEMENKEAIALCDSLDFGKAILHAAKNQKIWDEIIEIREKYFGEKDLSLEARKTYSQLGQVYAFAGDSRAEMCFFRAIKTGRDVNSLISMSYLLHYYADQGMGKKFDKLMKEYCDGRTDINEQLEYIVKEGTKGKDSLISLKFGLYVLVRGIYLFHMNEVLNDKELQKKLFNIEKTIISISTSAEKEINGHPWEIIYKYIALIARGCGRKNISESFIGKSEDILKKEDEVPKALLLAIVLFGKAEYMLASEETDTEVKKVIKKCWDKIKEINPDIYNGYGDPKSRTFENLEMLMSYMYH